MADTNTNSEPSFPKFGALPWELRNKIWEEAARPCGSIPHAHNFELFWDNLTGIEKVFRQHRSDIGKLFVTPEMLKTKAFDFHCGPIDLSRNGRQVDWLSHLKRVPDSRSAALTRYLYDVHGLWTACPESSKVIKKINRNSKDGDDMIKKMTTPNTGNFNDDLTEFIETDASRDLFCLSNSTCMEIMMGPYCGWQGEFPNDTDRMTRLQSFGLAHFLGNPAFGIELPVQRRSLTTGSLTTPPAALKNIAIGFEPRWNTKLECIGTEHASHEFYVDGGCFCHELSPRAFVIHMIRACNSHPERAKDLTFWIVDCRIEDLKSDKLSGEDRAIVTGRSGKPVMFEDFMYKYVDTTPQSAGALVGDKESEAYYNMTAERFYNFFVNEKSDFGRLDFGKYLRVLVRVPKVYNY